MLTRKDLERFAPRPRDAGRAAIWEGYIGAFIERGEEFCAEFGIDEQLELVHCLAQMAHETGGFTILWESGAYSAQRIMEIFGVGRHSARVTEAEAERIGALHGEDRAKALFERVYGLGNPSKAKELGNTEPGDGYRYRGCGPNQLTGRRDHERLLHGDYSYPSILRGSFSEFVEKGCLPLAMNDDIKQITRLINGGYNGLASRREWLAKSKKVWPKFPGDTPHKPPEQQKTMVTSKEGNVQVVNGAMGGGTAVFDAQQVVVKVIQKSAETGKPVALLDVVLALVSSPLFIGGMTVALASAASWYWRARKRWDHGV